MDWDTLMVFRALDRAVALAGMKKAPQKGSYLKVIIYTPTGATEPQHFKAWTAPCPLGKLAYEIPPAKIIGPIIDLRITFRPRAECFDENHEFRGWETGPDDKDLGLEVLVPHEPHSDYEMLKRGEYQRQIGANGPISLVAVSLTKDNGTRATCDAVEVASELLYASKRYQFTGTEELRTHSGYNQIFGYKCPGADREIEQNSMGSLVSQT